MAPTPAKSDRARPGHGTVGVGGGERRPERGLENQASNVLEAQCSPIASSPAPTGFASVEEKWDGEWALSHRWSELLFGIEATYRNGADDNILQTIRNIVKLSP
jgi:hypothetical protein